LPRSIAGLPITCIGRILKARAGQPAVTLLTDAGAQPLKPHGWEHFSS
jgi:thiamine-monophosphate kinase